MRWRREFEVKDDTPLGDAAITERIDRNTRSNMNRIKQVIEDRSAQQTA